MNYSIETLKAALEKKYKIVDEKQKGSSYQFKLSGGEIVNLYQNGNCNVQGKGQTQEIEAYLKNQEQGGMLYVNKKIFIVYGHAITLRDELESILRRWGLEPIIFDQLASGGQTIIEKLEAQIPEVGYGVVLATPDDEGYKKGKPEEKMFRCRQNVVLELGMLLAKLGRDRVAILQQNPQSTERPSDIQGLLYLPFEEKVSEASAALAREIEHKLGITITASQL